jgi:hypothetical protein
MAENADFPTKSDAKSLDKRLRPDRIGTKNQ